MDGKQFYQYYLGQKFLLDNKLVVGTEVDIIPDCLPILRPLADMTEDECFSVLSNNYSFPVLPEGRTSERFISYRLHYGNRRSKIMHEFFPVAPRTPQATHFLIKQGFDVFGLIDKGLAVNALTLKN